MVRGSIARKELSRTFKDGIETVVNQRVDFEFDYHIETLLEFIFDDWEYARDKGVYYNEDDELLYIEVDACLEEINDRILDEDYDSHREKKIIKYLEQYKGFTIWL